MSDERTPLLQSSSQLDGIGDGDTGGNLHTQFCHLIGTRPLNLPSDQDHKPHPESLYSRAVAHRRSQNFTYMFTATFSNFLILSQVVFGAALTGLAASQANHILIAALGAINTINAGLLAFIKSRGQPMRARMFRDDLERVVDEIENSAIMWLGISKGSHGYDAIDIDDQVTVRGEVARLTRLYDKAVKTSTANDPDTYSSGAPGDPHSAALKDKTAVLPSAPVETPAADASAARLVAATQPTAVEDPEDASPATKAAEEPAPAKDQAAASDGSKSVEAPKDQDDGQGKAEESKKTEGSQVSPEPKADVQAQMATAAEQPAPAAPINPDESPASSAILKKHTDSTAKAA